MPRSPRRCVAVNARTPARGGRGIIAASALNRRLHLSRLLPLAALLLCFACSAATPDRRIAITIDDLPWQHLGVGTDASAVPQQHAELIAALQAADAPVVGFVNEGKLELDGKVMPERVAMLRDWLRIGAELGNHSFGHLDLHAVGVEEFTRDILRGERQLRPLLATRAQTPRWFRHPFLRAGRSDEDKAAVIAFLAQHEYRVAPVTVDNSEWIWAGAYRKVLALDASEMNVETLARLRRDYVPYMLDKLDYYERLSIELLGYALPQVLLIHANALNAATYGELVAAIRARGYRTIDLDEAMQDPAYARADGYHGAYGPSWIHRWAIAEQRPPDFFAGEPRTPDWVMRLAGVDAE